MSETRQRSHEEVIRRLESLSTGLE